MAELSREETDKEMFLITKNVFYCSHLTFIKTKRLPRRHCSGEAANLQKKRKEPSLLIHWRGGILNAGRGDLLGIESITSHHINSPPRSRLWVKFFLFLPKIDNLFEE